AAAGGLPVPVVADDPRVLESGGESAPLAFGRGRVGEVVGATDLVDGERAAGVGGGHERRPHLVHPRLEVIHAAAGLRRGRGGYLRAVERRLHVAHDALLPGVVTERSPALRAWVTHLAAVECVASKWSATARVGGSPSARASVYTLATASRCSRVRRCRLPVRDVLGTSLVARPTAAAIARVACTWASARRLASSLLPLSNSAMDSRRSSASR